MPSKTISKMKRDLIESSDLEHIAKIFKQIRLFLREYSDSKKKRKMIYKYLFFS